MHSGRILRHPLHRQTHQGLENGAHSEANFHEFECASCQFLRVGTHDVPERTETRCCKLSVLRSQNELANSTLSTHSAGQLSQVKSHGRNDGSPVISRITKVVQARIRASAS